MRKQKIYAILWIWLTLLVKTKNARWPALTINMLTGNKFILTYSNMFIRGLTEGTLLKGVTAWWNPFFWLNLKWKIIEFRKNFFGHLILHVNSLLSRDFQPDIHKLCCEIDLIVLNLVDGQKILCSEVWRYIAGLQLNYKI